MEGFDLRAIITHQMIQANGVKLHVALAGPEKGQPVLLLHGFPECWYGWSNQIDCLVDAGYRLIIPDQRGYNLSDSPSGVDNYRIEVLARDQLFLIDHLGYAKVHVVGHDWGAMVAWWLGMFHAERLVRLVVMNVPHPEVMRRFLYRDIRQLMRSWYVFMFQLPWLPELIFSSRGGSLALNYLLWTAKDGTFSSKSLEVYQESWQRQNIPTGMLNWYRAAMRKQPSIPRNDKVSVPTMIIWGMKDVALRHQMATESRKKCVDGKLEMLPQATHWVHHDEADKVNQMLIDWLRP